MGVFPFAAAVMVEICLGQPAESVHLECEEETIADSGSVKRSLYNNKMAAIADRDGRECTI